MTTREDPSFDNKTPQEANKAAKEMAILLHETFLEAQKNHDFAADALDEIYRYLADDFLTSQPITFLEDLLERLRILRKASARQREETESLLIALALPDQRKVGQDANETSGEESRSARSHDEPK